MPADVLCDSDIDRIDIGPYWNQLVPANVRMPRPQSTLQPWAVNRNGWIVELKHWSLYVSGSSWKIDGPGLIMSGQATAAGCAHAALNLWWALYERQQAQSRAQIGEFAAVLPPGEVRLDDGYHEQQILLTGEKLLVACFARPGYCSVALRDVWSRHFYADGSGSTPAAAVKAMWVSLLKTKRSELVRIEAEIEAAEGRTEPVWMHWPERRLKLQRQQAELKQRIRHFEEFKSLTIDRCPQLG